MNNFSIAVVGATGLVGSTLLQLLEERNFPIHKLYLVASQQSATKSIEFRNEKYVISVLDTFDFSQTQIAFFCVSNDLAEKYAPIATAKGNIVIDKSYFYRNHKDVPLVIPEVNLSALNEYKKLNIVASPNCNTIPIAVGLKPIYDAVGVSRINISTYQSVSGTGKEAVAELKQQTKNILDEQSFTPSVYHEQIAFNVVPHCDDFLENGYTREEMKMVWELQKIFSDPTLMINPTAVRVPVFCGHAAAVHIETKDNISIDQALELLAKGNGITLMTGSHPYATPVRHAAGTDHVYVGRVRKDISHKNGINFWVVADNLRKGAALNAIQIAEHLARIE